MAERSLAHRRAAELMDDDPAGEERAAEHLLATEPAGDASIARRLVDAARTAARRGAPESAAVLLRRALAEPPPAAERPRPAARARHRRGDGRAGRRRGPSARGARRRAGDDHGVALGATLVLAHALGRAERIEDAVAVVDRTAARLRTPDEHDRRAARDAGADGGHARREHGAGARRAPEGAAPARRRAAGHARGARRGRHARGRRQRAGRGRDRAGAPRLRRQPAARAGADRPAVVRPGDHRARVGRRLRRGHRPDRGRPGREPRGRATARSSPRA